MLSQETVMKKIPKRLPAGAAPHCRPCRYDLQPEATGIKGSVADTETPIHNLYPNQYKGNKIEPSI